MLKFWIFVIIAADLAVLGLCLGSANDARVVFDFLFVKTELTLAQVFVYGAAFGLAIGLILCLTVYLRVRVRLSQSRRETRQAVKREQALLAKSATAENQG